MLVLLRSDLPAVWAEAARLGWWGLCAVLALRAVAAIPDVGSWLLTLPGVPVTARWLGRLYLVHAYGEALNSVTPLASLGGEPVKAGVLKRHFGVGYRDATASLTLAQTINTIALVAFLVVTLPFAAGGGLSASQHLAAAAGLAALGAAIAVFYVLQRQRAASRIGRWLAARRRSARLERMVSLVGEVEERLVTFYRDRRARLTASLVLAFLTWTFGVLEVVLVLAALGQPVSVGEAWLIHGAVLLVRTVLFVLPSSIGTQEATFLIVGGAVTGSPEAALALALIRRCRELAWILVGFAAGARFATRTA